MCFSAQASFIAAGGLAVLGLMSMRIAKNRSELFLAATPFIFAIQQAAEGLLWLTLPEHTFLAILPTYLYVFFAFMFWPVWIPFVIGRYEKEFWRKVVIYACMALGVLFALFLLRLLFIHGSQASIEHHHITYSISVASSLFYALFFNLLYFLSAVAPMFISSRRYVWVMGAATSIAYLASLIFFPLAIASIWCFFAAIISGTTIYIIHINHAHE